MKFSEYLGEGKTKSELMRLDKIKKETDLSFKKLSKMILHYNLGKDIEKVSNETLANIQKVYNSIKTKLK